MRFLQGGEEHGLFMEDTATSSLMKTALAKDSLTLPQMYPQQMETVFRNSSRTVSFVKENFKLSDQCRIVLRVEGDFRTT